MSSKKRRAIQSGLQGLVELIEANARRHQKYRVFSDFCELAALSFSNAVDLAQREAREARYLQIVSGYEREEVERFPQMLGQLVNQFETSMGDHLGALFMTLGLGDSGKGQFFTPFELSSLMARMIMGDTIEQSAGQPYLTMSEPACGAGGMVIACAATLRERGINYQQRLHVVATDVDLVAVHMTYVQLSLLHIPAIVVHGDSLTVTEWGHWVTPAHVLGGWDWKLSARRAIAAVERVAGEGEGAGGAGGEGEPVMRKPEAPGAEAAPSLKTIRDSVVDARISQLALFQ